MKKNILVVGAAGFLGQTITRYFNKQGDTIYGIDLVQPENAPIHELKEYQTMHLPDDHFVDLLKKWQPDVCLHCGGLASVPYSYLQPQEDYQNGPFLTFYLLNQIRQVLPACKFILLSSAAVYGNPETLPVHEQHKIAPISVYGFHKWQSEILCSEFATVYGMKTASARIFSAYGIGLRRQVVWDIIYKILTQPEVILQGDGNESRDFVHADDIAFALETIIQSAPMQGESYNVASGIETKISELVAMISSTLHSEKLIKYSGELPAGTPTNWRADLRRIASIGYSPKLSLQTGIESMLKWCSYEIQSELNQGKYR